MIYFFKHLKLLKLLGINKALSRDVNRGFSEISFEKCAERGNLNLLSLKCKDINKPTVESIPIERESAHLLGALDKLNALELERKVVYISIYCRKETFIFTMLVGDQRYHLVSEGATGIEIKQQSLFWLGHELHEREIIVVSYTGGKYEMKQLARMLKVQEGDCLDETFNVEFKDTYYLSEGWREILKINLFAVAEEVYKTQQLLRAKASRQRF